MNVLFLVERNMYYKYYGRYIDEILELGNTVFALHNYNGNIANQNDIKRFSRPLLNQIPQFQGGVVNPSIYLNYEEIEQFIKDKKIEVVFSLLSKKFYGLENTDVRWICLQHGQDSFQEDKILADLFFIYTKNWLPMGKKIDSEIVETGALYLRSKCAADHNSIKEKYRLPLDKKILLYLPLPIGYKLSRIKSLKLKHKYNEFNILHKLKEFCEKMNYHLVIKSRYKLLLPQEYSEYGDVFYDESFYPATIYEMMEISDIVINNLFSLAIYEAIYFKTKLMTIVYDDITSDIVEQIKSNIWKEKFDEFFNPKGLNTICEYSRLNEMVLERLAESEPAQARYNHYIDKFLFPSSCIQGCLNVREILMKFL